MKKLVVIFLVFMLLCAFSWPPENYEMPRTVLDATTAEKSLSGLRASAGSIANTGLILIGIITSVSLISTFFKRLFLDKLDKPGCRFSGALCKRFRSPEPLAESHIRERDLNSTGRIRYRQGSDRS